MALRAIRNKKIHLILEFLNKTENLATLDGRDGFLQTMGSDCYSFLEIF